LGYWSLSSSCCSSPADSEAYLRRVRATLAQRQTANECSRQTPASDVHLAWRDVWIGAAMTSLLFTLGKFLLGLYLGYSGVTSAYGAAGSLVVVLLWVYYLALIFFFGAEFTQVYASVYGAGVEPADNAQPLSTGAHPQ
jgi:hypothetical protein